VTSAWSESTLTNNTSASLTFGLPKHADLPINSTGNFVSIDVTDWVQAWLAGTLANQGFQIETGATSSALNLYFDSKESTQTSHEPQLDIVLAGPAGPQGSPGPQGLQGLQGLTGATGAVGQQGLPGASGAAGPAGMQGPQGLQGVAGANGNKWYSSTGAPAQTLGLLNDYYLDAATGDVWQKVSNGGNPVWALQGNIRGAQGSTGPTGSAGAVGAQGPVGQTGLTGSQGPQGQQGAIGPKGDKGDQGAAGSQGIPGTGAGTQWYAANGRPAQTLGLLYDYYLDVATGDVWQKLMNDGGPTWFMEGNIRGPAGGPQGEPGPVAGIDFNFLTDQADSDPGNGNFKVNASTGEIYLSYVDVHDYGLFPMVDSMLQSTNPVKGYFVATRHNNPREVMMFAVSSGAATNGYYKLAATRILLSGGSWLDDNAPAKVVFIRNGDKGDKGDAGMAGSSGTQGPVGTAGATGPQGLPGAAGLVGAAGPVGPIGPPGPAGPMLTRIQPQGDLSMGEFTQGPIP
jgi:hypothetical protein